jgi:YVTN family beta-propeller protein
MRALSCALLFSLLAAACGGGAPSAGMPSPAARSPEVFEAEAPAFVAAPVDRLSVAHEVAPALKAQPGALPALSAPKALRIFVTAEGPYSGGTGEVWVLETSGGPVEVVARIPQGGWPHNISISPDGRYVGVANRSGNQVSIIDPLALKEIARIPVGKTPHGITWRSDSQALFIAHEREQYIGRIDVGTWRVTPLYVGVSQHVTLSRPERPNELWFTLTDSLQPDHLRMFDLATGTITKVKVNDVHDAFFSPDGSEIWSSSSGFLDKPSDRVVIYDPDARAVKEQVRFAGRYPFHGMKTNRDGLFFLPDPSIMLISSHYSAERGRNGASLLWIDWKARKIVGDTPLGPQVFHATYDPIGERVLATSNLDGMVNVIDAKTRQVVQKVPVPKAHGIVALGVY